MSDMEQNRQIVQEGLDKRANKRKKAITEAEQEAITNQMFHIVNTNALIAPKVEVIEIKRHKANKRNKKMIRNMSAVNAIAAFLAIITSIILYALHLTEIIPAVVISVFPVIILIYNTYLFTKAQKKMKRRR